MAHHLSGAALALSALLIFTACDNKSAPEGQTAPDRTEKTSPGQGMTDSAPNSPSDAQTEAASDADMGGEAAIEAAVNAPDRLDRDKARDADRKPGQVLAFIGLEPGMDVYDLLGGGGYYAELIARVVGPEGSVVMMNNPAYLPYVKDEMAERFAGGRMAGIKRPVSEVDDIEIAPDGYDMVTFILGYHDAFHAEDNWPAIDRPKLLAKLYRGLRPGGVLAIVDHRALAGADPAESGHTVHRVDPDVVKKEVEAAGFVLDGESNILARPDDDLSKVVFDPSIRGKTNRFVFRFIKPE